MQVALKAPLATDIEVVPRKAKFWLKASGNDTLVSALDVDVYGLLAVIVSEHVARGNLFRWMKARQFGFARENTLFSRTTPSPHAMRHPDAFA